MQNDNSSGYILNEDTAMIPMDEIYSRIGRLKKGLGEKGIGAALILQNSDLYYFSGTIQQSSLYIPARGEPLLMVRKNFDRAKMESPLADMEPITGIREIPVLMKKRGYDMPALLGLELDVLPVNLYSSYMALFDSSKPADISGLIRETRSVKSEYEIGIIREAAELSDRLAGSVKEHLREGTSEIEFAGRVEAEARALGHQGIVRMRLWGSEIYCGHIMSGPSAAVPSYLSSPTGGASVSRAVAQGPGFRPIRRNEPVLVDFAFAWKGYISDHTRIFSLGELPEDLMKGHRAMVDLQNHIKALSRPGTGGGEIYTRAMEFAETAGYGEHFMGYGPGRIRFVGHGVGLELDEPPFLAQGQSMELQENMVIALEPKLIFPGRGVVGVENTFLVTEQGAEQLGKYSNEIEVL